MMILFLIIGYGGAILFGLIIGVWVRSSLVKTLIELNQALRKKLEAETRRADLTKKWAEATFQNIADAAADYGLQLQIGDCPIEPRPEAKEWPQVVGER